jgi:hypothetical protein
MHIAETIHQGVALEVAQSKLKECGFKTTLDPVKNILYADFVNAKRPVAMRTQVIVRFDSNRSVTEVRVSTGLIGP